MMMHIYARKIKSGDITIEDVPHQWSADTEEYINSNNSEQYSPALTSK